MRYTSATLTTYLISDHVYGPSSLYESISLSIWHIIFAERLSFYIQRGSFLFRAAENTYAHPCANHIQLQIENSYIIKRSYQ